MSLWVHPTKEHVEEPDAMAMDQSALIEIEVLEALRAAEVDDRLSESTMELTKSHCRPRPPTTARINPRSEREFKTLEQHPTSRTGSARWRMPAASAPGSSPGHTERLHAGGLLTPADDHTVRAQLVSAARAMVPDGAYRHHRSVRPQAACPASAAGGGVDQQRRQSNGAASAIPR